MEIVVEKRIMPPLNLSANVRSLMRIFSLTADDIRRPIISLNTSLNVRPGGIYFITGASGVGKSLLLREIAGCFPSNDRINIDLLPLSQTAAMIDCFKSVPKALRCLSQMGLSDVTAFLLPPAILSEGQKYRYRLAKSICSNKPIVVADEFCSALDKLTASLLCIRLRRIADATGKIFLLAGHCRGLMPDLLPDCILKVQPGGEIEKLCRIDQTDIYERL
jgi:uncharacterized protein